MTVDTTIGFPVYNGELTLRAALDSLLNQDYADFELLICDNASIDTTADICNEYALKDPRIRVVRHDFNRGGVANFEFALQAARTPFFMWAAADDVRSTDFIRLNRQFLIDNPEFVASVSPVRFTDGDFDRRRMGDGLLDAPTVDERINNFLSGLHANGAFYSLFRREPLTKSLITGHSFIGHDWSTVIRLAALGPLQRISDGFLELGHDGTSSSRMRFRLFRRRRRSWLIPLYEVSHEALEATKSSPIGGRLRVIYSLAKINFTAVMYQIVLESDLLYAIARFVRSGRLSSHLK